MEYKFPDMKQNYIATYDKLQYLSKEMVSMREVPEFERGVKWQEEFDALEKVIEDTNQALVHYDQYLFYVYATDAMKLIRDRRK